MMERLRPALSIGKVAFYPNVAAVDNTILPRQKHFIVDDYDQAHAVRSCMGNGRGKAANE
jgi:hypothetical protein